MLTLPDSIKGITGFINTPIVVLALATLGAINNNQ
ncbi:hypothetical protein PSBY109024_15790 [Pseudoalteromonas byunsanensis]